VYDSDKVVKPLLVLQTSIHPKT